MSADAQINSLACHTQLLSRTVVLALCCLLTIAGSQKVFGGCHFGHAAQSAGWNAMGDSLAYAREFKVLGQWIYEAGQVKYVAWQPDGQCHGPNCSANREPSQPSTGLSLPAHYRTQTSFAASSIDVPPVTVQRYEVVSLNSARPRAGYPPAYEYPP